MLPHRMGRAAIAVALCVALLCSTGARTMNFCLYLNSGSLWWFFSHFFVRQLTVKQRSTSMMARLPSRGSRRTYTPFPVRRPRSTEFNKRCSLSPFRLLPLPLHPGYWFDPEVCFVHSLQLCLCGCACRLYCPCCFSH